MSPDPGRRTSSSIRNVPEPLPHLALMMDCLRDPSCERPAEIPRNVDETALLETLRFHHVLTTVALQLAATDLSAASKEVLTTARRDQALRELRMQVDMQTLAEAFDEAQIPWMVVKGAALEAGVYPKPYLRHYIDLDVLISRHDFERALQALDQRGGRIIDNNWPAIAERMGGEVNYALPHGTVLDLHWHLVNSRQKRRRFTFDTEAMLERRRSLQTQLGAVPCPDAADQVVHVAVHAAISGGHRLSWLKDLQMCAAASPPWDEVVDRARAASAATVVAVMLERAREVLDAAVPDAVLDALAPRHGWRAQVRHATRRWPPEHADTGGSGQIVIWSTRSSTARSAAALVWSVVNRPATVRRNRRVVGNPLHLAVPDAAARTRFFDQLTRAAEP